MLLVAAGGALAVLNSAAATLPNGFTEALVASGLSSPTAMEFAPDGRLFVCQQGGQLRVIKNGLLLAAPFLTVTADSVGERGLLGIAFDPNFAANQYVYIYYTAITPAVHNRVSRFTASGDTAVVGSEVVILDLNNLSGASNHNGGGIHFGKDGKLYIAAGENANSANAQTLANLLGKMLRLNADGSIPTDNPFYNTASGVNRAIWALGLRNPFSFAVQPGTGRLFINDVGENVWEEINDAVAGANYGWPNCEGDCSPANSNYSNPVFRYQHGSGATAGFSIAGGTFYNPATVQFPSTNVGTYFFADYVNGWIRRLDPANGNQVGGFATGINAPVDLKVGADGRLYYLARGGGAVYAISYTGSQSPQITQQPADQTVPVGQAATFTVTASGTSPLKYQWRRDGANLSGATNTSYTLNSSGVADDGATFRCAVTNVYGAITSSPALLHISGNNPPVGTITFPTNGTLFSGGQTIQFAGTASDPEDGNRPASAFSWMIVFHHDTHTHPFQGPMNGVTNGSFVIATQGETSANVWYRIYLTVTDSTGQTNISFRDVRPRTAVISLTTSPPGLQVTLDGQPVTTPVSVTNVVGMNRTLGVISPQTQGGTTYQFASWSDGGAATHTISGPPTATTYTATHQAVSSALAITTASMPNGTVNVAYSATLAASGGSTPYAWSIASGSLPPGLILNPNSGNITGMPGTTGTFNFTAQVNDSSNPIQIATKALVITITSTATTVTIWPTTAVPGTVDAGIDSAVELGVKFRSDVGGTIKGIRFYKATANIGTHVGNLWTRTGTLLATATFTGETASGWQQVNFATPVTITANSVYVASYHANDGHWSVSWNYFAASGVDSPPLHALGNGVSGGNGVYRYGTDSLFPDLTWITANYWVDVVFQTTGTPTLNSIAVTPVNLTIGVGATQQFIATGTYSDGSTQNITGQAKWVSSSPGVATIDTNGLAASSLAGTTTISATLAGKNGSTPLTVQAGTLTIITTSLPNGTANVAYSETLAANGGTTPHAWSLASGSLPAGLTLNSTSGAISGTPTTAGTFSFTARVSDTSSPVQSATKALSITVATTFISISVTPVNPTISIGVTQQFAATGTYSDSSTQNISGQVTWTSSSTAVATITAAGLAMGASSGNTTIMAALSGVSGSTTLTVQVAALSISTASLPNGTVNVAYTATLTASGGSASYIWSVSSGSLPGGLTLNPNSGAINGTPTSAGTFSFYARVDDSSSPVQSVSRAFGIVVASTPTTFGNTNDGTLTDVMGAGWINAGRFQATANLTVGTIVAKVGAITGKYKCAIYGDNLGQPSRLLRGSAELVNPSAGWQAFPLTSSMALTNGQYYWLGIWSDSANSKMYYSGNDGTLRWGNYSYGTWPDPFATAAGASVNYSIYATGTTAPPPLLASIAAPPVRPRILSISMANGLVTIMWSAVEGRNYALEYANNLTDMNWSPLLPPVLATGSTVTVTNNGVGDLPQRFYRVKLFD